jgi:aspartate/methionine/tyrosine aminotransferase
MLGELPDFALEVYLGEWEFAARHDLTASDAQTLTIAELLALARPDRRTAFEQLALSYTPTWGTPELLDAVASTYERLGPEHVLTFAGAEEAMFWALQGLVGPGDHAVVTVPNYQSMESLTLATGADVDGLVLSPVDGWALDLDALTKLLRPTTRLVCVNFPNNPTGALPSRQTFTRLAQLCDELEVGRSSPPKCRCSTPSSNATPTASIGHRRMAVACASRGCATARTPDRSAAGWYSGPA